jgi:hypothetical protein
MKFKALMFLAMVAMPYASAAQDADVTQEDAVACMTFDSLRTFWTTIDKLPADVDYKAYKASLQCLSLPGNLTFIKLDEISDGVIGLRGMLVMKGETFEVWISDTDLQGH